MKVKDSIRRISYTPWVGKIIGRLRLRGVMQKLYAFVWANRDMLKLNLNGIEGLFCAQTPVELRIVEAAWFGEREMLGVVQQTLNAGDTFLDAGSNLGIFTIFAAKAVGPQGAVIACEPETIAHNRLQRNIENNQLQNVRLLKLALSDKRSKQKLLLGDPGGVSQSAHISDAEGPFEIVQTADYDSLVADEGFPVPRVIKMDIEGHEYAALQGMKRALSSPSCVALFCEVHPYALPDGISTGEVVGMIKSLGFDSISTSERGPQFHVVARKLSA